VVLKLKPALQQSEGRSKPWSGSRLVNAFAEKADGDKVEDFAVMAVPGLVRFANISSLAVRGLHRMGIDALRRRSGTRSTASPQPARQPRSAPFRGRAPSRSSTTGPSWRSRRRDQRLCLFVGHGSNRRQPARRFGRGLYRRLFRLDRRQFRSVHHFGLNDGLTYDPLDVATVEGAPDNLVGVVNSHRELLFFGTDTLEIWYDSGDADFPFARQGNAFIERGCIDKDSIVKLDNSVHFIGDDRICYRLDGYQPIRISTHAIELKLAQATYFRAFSYSQEGHKFYCLNTDVGSFCYDMATGAWAERISFGRVNYRVGSAVTAYGPPSSGDNATGRLYTPDLDVFDEDGDPCRSIIELPTIEGKRERATMYAFEAYCETGVGNSDVEDPQIIMQYSRDGGRQWSNEMSRSMGKVGPNIFTRAVWRPDRRL
jgi:hypothetical protein